MPRVARRKDTLAATRKIYRSDDTAIAGVCSGVAEGLDMDPATVRILAVLLVLATFGLFTLVYATLWLVLPKHVAISPETLPCDAYAADGSPRPCFSEDDSPCGIGPHGWSRAGMWIGTAALAVITAFSLTIIAPKVEWWQFLPIAVCLTGAALMITPSRSMARLRRFSLGLMLMFCGLTLLAVSVGVVDFEMLLYGISKLWPGLFVVIGLVLIGKAMQDDLFYFAAAACFAVLLAAATFGFAPPAPLEVIEISPSPFTPRGMF